MRADLCRSSFSLFLRCGPVKSSSFKWEQISFPLSPCSFQWQQASFPLSPSSFSESRYRSLFLPVPLNESWHRSFFLPVPLSDSWHRSLLLPVPLSESWHRSLFLPVPLSEIPLSPCSSVAPQRPTMAADVELLQYLVYSTVKVTCTAFVGGPQLRAYWMWQTCRHGNCSAVAKLDCFSVECLRQPVVSYVYVGRLLQSSRVYVKLRMLSHACWRCVIMYH